ncbi:MAG: Holliday junction resolvase RuvX [Planctomycetota bacterium]|nr:MAG: Holliday junction resolvase RuvX [Planctomycetota bacterium]
MAETGRIVAVDYGRARIGVAVCDALGISTKPLGFIPRKSDEQAARTLAALLRQERAVHVVIGLPLHAHGDAGENVAWVRAFTACLARYCSLPITEVDERHSSQEAEAALRAEGRWPAKPGEVDAKAAAILLRRYLDGER